MKRMDVRKVLVGLAAVSIMSVTPAFTAYGQTGSATSEKAQSGGLPKTFKAYDNSYTITSFTIGVDNDGNTVVKCKGTGFQILHISNGEVMLPVGCSLTAGGKEYKCRSTSTRAEGIDFVFDGKVNAPKTVIFYPGDNREQRVKIPVK
jgi:hypothetical protein